MPDNYPAWFDSPEAIAALGSQAEAAGRDWTFGWIRLANGARADDLGVALGALGGEILGSSGPLVRVRLPGEATLLEQISFLPEVAGIGAPPRSVKLPEALANEVQSLSAEQQMPVFISLMAGDPDGQWRRALENLGAVVGRFDADIRAFTATVDWPALDAIADADFVLAIEPVGLVEAAHDTAVPAMGVDALRWYSGSPGLFRGIGGASVPIAVMDTGLNINHPDIFSNRRSVCGANFVWVDSRRSDYDLWVDDGGHGTHVTGTIAGNGYGRPELAGMAPAVSHIRFAKVLHHRGFGYFDSILQGMDYLSLPSGCGDSGTNANRVKPLIVNMSLSASANIFEGRGTGERKLDSVVWTHRQLYVVAQSNAGSYAFSNFGTAKNSLSVGAALDSGELASFSSYGPTADGRLAPQIVATGVDVHSTRGFGSRGGYASYSGTSMASPTVAGVAALLMDAAPAYREQPALTRARLMASAIRPNIWHEEPTQFPHNNSNGPGALQNQFGLGKVSARTSVLNRDQADGWVGGGAVSQIEDGDLASQDIVVPAGAGQLALVMTWDEPPTETIAGAVLNDLDLYLDLDANCGSTACGEYRSRSRKDNVEWIIVDNPPPGTHRAKIVSRRVFTEPPRAALAWTIIRGETTPSLRVESDTESLEDSGEITLTVTADSYVAAGTRLEVNCRTADGPCSFRDWELKNPEVAREDRLASEIQWDSASSPLIELGEIAAGESQELNLGVSYEGIDAARLYFTVTAWNAESASTQLQVRKSGTEAAFPDLLERPANSDFAFAAELKESPQKFDLLLSGSEPGEPSFPQSRQSRRPSNSVWYDWTAPTEGFYRFDVRPDSDDQRKSSFETGPQLDLYTGDSLTTLKQIAVGDSSAVEFFAPAREKYKIRISYNGEYEVAPVVLRWSREPPKNDRFVDSIEIEGANDKIQGNNQGATVEPGESFGALAATVWYRWAAPEDGDWRFGSDNDDLRILVFTGDEFSELRLISASPSRYTTFPAERGREYRIALAADDAYGGGGSYELSWRPQERSSIGNDDFENAKELSDSMSSSAKVEIDHLSTVEPGEPIASGVRTRWYEWTAPESGYYTWRLFDPDSNSAASLNFVVSVFAGNSLTDLEVIAANDPFSTLAEFVFQAVKNERYFISLGYRNNTFSAFNSRSSESILSWGPTPENDNSTQAITIDGISGAIGGSNEFATVDLNERTGTHGIASLWYELQVPTTGWVRFHFDQDTDESDSRFSLVVYRSNDGALARASQGNVGSEVIFEAESGVKYLIRLGILGNPLGGEFMLRWEEIAPPGWLKFRDVLKDGDVDANGRAIELGSSWRSSLAFSSDGSVLYRSVSRGVQVFERDPVTGKLKLAQLVEYMGDSDPLDIFWDPFRSRLLAKSCYRDFWQFDSVDENPLQLNDRMLVSVDRGADFNSCGSNNQMFMDKTGEYFYFLNFGEGLEVFTFTRDGMEYVQSVKLEGAKQAIVSRSNEYIYALADNSLQVYSRDLGSGRLTPDRLANVPTSSVMAISDDGQYLFTVGPFGSADASVYRLNPGSDPQLLGELNESLDWKWSYCTFAATRGELPAVDVFCNGFAFSLAWLPDTQELIQTDYAGLDEMDRFGKFVPDFGRIYGNSVASPDGRHVYLAAEDGSLVIFERVGNTEAQVSTAPVLTSATGSLQLPLAEFREGTGTQCFTAELRGATDSGNWMGSANWTLASGATTDCAPEAEAIPSLEATTRILRIPHGRILDENGMTCFTAELQASEDFQDWTLLAGQYRACPQVSF